MTAATRAVDVFVDAGMLAAETGVLPDAGRTLAQRLIAEGHGDILADLTAAFWQANDARLARRDRWDAHRSALDPGEKEPPPPPDPRPDPKPEPQPQPDQGGE